MTTTQVPALLSTHLRPPRASAGAATLTFGWRALLKIKHVPEQFADVIAIPIVFTVMFTYLFGGALAGSTGRYLQFLLPGTLVMAVLLLTMYSGIGLTTDMRRGLFDRFRTMPIWQPAPLIGALLGDAGRYVIASSLVLALGLAMGYRPAAGALGVLAAVGLIIFFALSLSWVWTALAMLVRTPTAVSPIVLVVLFPLTLASNAFVDPSTMPGWLQVFVHLNPISHLVTADRGLLNSAAVSSEIIWVTVVALAITAVFGPFTMFLYRRRL